MDLPGLPLGVDQMIPRCSLFVLVPALIFSSHGQSQVPKETPTKKYALLIGVNAYDSNNFPNLTFAQNDAEELAKVLLSREVGFTSVRVLTTTRGKKKAGDKPTSKNIRQA